MAATSLRLCCAAVPAAERFDFLRESYGRTVLGVELDPIEAAPFDTDVVLQTLPELGIAAGNCSRMQANHTARLADNDDLVLLVATAGGTVMQHRGREALIRDGEAVLTSAAEPSCNRMLGSTGFLNLSIPQRVLAPMVGDLAAVLMRPVARDNPALQLLTGYFRAFTETSLADARLSRVVASQVHDLVALALGATRDAAELARGRGVRAARLRRIKDDVLERLHEPGLSAPAMAARHGVSERYLRKLFEQEGTSFSAHVLEQRLAQVCRRLGDPRCAAMSISALAYATGFNDLSYFNKAFRRAYGASPSEIRAGG